MRYHRPSTRTRRHAGFVYRSHPAPCRIRRIVRYNRGSRMLLYFGRFDSEARRPGYTLKPRKRLVSLFTVWSRGYGGLPGSVGSAARGMTRSFRAVSAISDVQYVRVQYRIVYAAAGPNLTGTPRAVSRCRTRAPWRCRFGTVRVRVLLAVHFEGMELVAVW